MVRPARRADRSAPGRLHDGLIRERIGCRGTVQGVGFRPAVYRLAQRLGLVGFVRNDPGGATVEVQGPPDRVRRFRHELRAALPALARLDGLDVQAVAPARAHGFAIQSSSVGTRGRALVPPDAAICPACRADLDDARDRRHGYPFTTCTDCGPRFTLVRGLPYDRERTSMEAFPLCPACAREFEDPGDRRFHAVALACPACGPHLELAARNGAVLARDRDALDGARALLDAGGILALQGLGGFQLACRADAPATVRRLRRAKARPTRPFALMAADLAAARRLVMLEEAHDRLLESPVSPIVLAPRRGDAPVADGVAPGVGDLGVMLPTSPLHVELLRDARAPALVMTSGNAGGEPLCRTPAEARERLGTLADRLLWHDREVLRRADDSVVRTLGTEYLVVRRSRGWVPEPLPLPARAPRPVLALGGHLQVTACLAVDDRAFPSQHVGDLDDDRTRGFLAQAAHGLEEFLEVEASELAVDAHPDYPSAWLGAELARKRGGRVIPVHHHLAHAAAVLADRERFPGPDGEALAWVLDGTGYGPDGSAWGCELLALRGDLSWRRLGHGRALPLVGGERAVREPWRIACAVLQRAGRGDLVPRTALARGVDAGSRAAIARLAEQAGWPSATGAGRLFEAAGALFGLATHNGYEGEAALRFEALAAAHARPATAWPELAPEGATLPSDLLLVAAAERLAAGASPHERLAAEFHATFCRLAIRLLHEVAPPGASTVALAGGCLVNRLLAQGLSRELEALGLVPLLPRRVPPGDGGLAYGQAALAAVAGARGSLPRYEGGP